MLLKNNKPCTKLKFYNKLFLWKPKSPEYYEYTANKAIETTPERYTPKVQSALKKPANGNNSGGNGKR